LLGSLSCPYNEGFWDEAGKVYRAGGVASQNCALELRDDSSSTFSMRTSTWAFVYLRGVCDVEKPQVKALSPKQLC
jgi:hypothetical protein